jgi:energy-coupling factor transporter ATP-binding protein EcfA2
MALPGNGKAVQSSEDGMAAPDRSDDVRLDEMGRNDDRPPMTATPIAERDASPEHDVSSMLAAIEEGMRNMSDVSDALLPTTSHRGIDTADDRGEGAATTTTATSSTVEEASKKFAPPGMEGSFQQLYRALLPCLTQTMTKKGHQRPNASVFVHGPRGCGKSLLVQSCLQALRHEEPTARFRPVFCSSLLHVPFQRSQANAGAGAVVEEILRQLVDQSRSASSLHGELLRLRHTSFTNHLQLLNEILQMASTDGIPVVFVLDNVSQFPPLLLYHLLDRIAGSGTNTGTANSSYSLCLIAMATHALTNQKSSSFVEKRIVSRVEGTSSLIHLPAASCSSERLLQAKLPPLLRPAASRLFEDEDLAQLLRRQERMGQSARWFCRLFYSALASWREELRRREARDANESDFCEFVRDALEDAGIVVEHHDPDGQATNKRSRRSLPSSILQDLSVPQLLLALAATRILVRGNRSKPSSADRGSGAPIALTLQGMMAEVMDKLYRGNPPPNATSHVLQRAFLDLLDMAVLRPACDHSGTAPFQYYERENVLDATSWEVLARVPLHLTFDVYRDVLPSLEGGELTAPTAVLEWGRRPN